MQEFILSNSLLFIKYKYIHSYLIPVRHFPNLPMKKFHSIGNIMSPKIDIFQFPEIELRPQIHHDSHSQRF